MYPEVSMLTSHHCASGCLQVSRQAAVMVMMCMGTSRWTQIQPPAVITCKSVLQVGQVINTAIWCFEFSNKLARIGGKGSHRCSGFWKLSVLPNCVEELHTCTFLFVCYRGLNRTLKRQLSQVSVKFSDTECS